MGLLHEQNHLRLASSRIDRRHGRGECGGPYLGADFGASQRQRRRLFAGAETFPKTGQETRGVIARIKGPQATCVFDGLKPGTYAVAAFHAEDNETQMQYGLFGKPKESYGFSRNPPPGMGPPAFAAAAFDYAGGAKTAAITLHY